LWRLSLSDRKKSIKSSTDTERSSRSSRDARNDTGDLIYEISSGTDFPKERREIRDLIRAWRRILSLDKYRIYWKVQSQIATEETDDCFVSAAISSSPEDLVATIAVNRRYLRLRGHPEIPEDLKHTIGHEMLHLLLEETVGRVISVIRPALSEELRDLLDRLFDAESERCVRYLRRVIDAVPLR
jgi:hypothetical protein